MTPATFEARIQRGGEEAVRELSRFHMGQGPVHETLRRLAARLDAAGVPHAFCGGMALVAHGFLRGTVDVDVLVTPAGLAATHHALEGLGYAAPFRGSKNLRDVSTNVRVEFLVTGQYPGDGKPKDVSFPDPAQVSVEMEGVRYVSLPTLIELKLASGMTGGVTRLKDLGDVVELIRIRRLADDFAEQLHPYVREKFLELARGVREAPPDLAHE